jgi:hypothetical protein
MADCAVSKHSLDVAEVFGPGALMTNQRRSIRFPIEREARYKTVNRRAEAITGVGKTLNISSSGVLFTSEHDLPLGARVEVSISWPVALNVKCLLNFVAQGRVVRYSKGEVAVHIQKYEFRTQEPGGSCFAGSIPNLRLGPACLMERSDEQTKT